MEMHIADAEEDKLEWDGSTNGVITVKVAYNHYREKNHTFLWKKAFWRKFIPQKMSIFSWKVVNNRLTTSDRLYEWGVLLTPVCTGCINGSRETVNDIL